MRKKIFGFMSISAVLGVTVLSLLVALTTSFRLSSLMQTALRNERVTIIAENGEVLFDNYANPDSMDNHLNRPEIQDAMRYGYGESERQSESLLETSYYYAIRLNDNTFLRLSVITNSVYSMIMDMLPVFVLCALAAITASFAAARALTNRIIAPINALDINAREIDTYDELAPLVGRILKQRREINHQLEALENRANTIKTIAENMTEGFVLTDGDGVILTANNSAKQTFKSEEAEGKNIIEICRDKDFLNAVNSCFLNGSRAETMLHTGGNTYSVYCDPVYEASDKSKAFGLVVLLLDITEKNKAEIQRREFTANVSHELKTPLTTVSGYIELLENNMINDEDKPAFLAKVSAQIKRLKNLVDDIIRLSEFDEGKQTGEFITVSMLTAANNAAEALRNTASEKNVEISVTGHDVTVRAVEHMIDELLFNLIDNGIKYSNDGGTVIVRVEQEERYCIVTVNDTGIGIPQEHIPRVFERFYTVDKSRSKQSGGTGLGLSIVKRIAEIHSARVDITSEPGKWTCAQVKLPVWD